MTKTVMQVSVVTYSAAASMVETALAHAAKNNWRVAAAVLDPWGAVVASGRMDGASPSFLEFATDKAFTSTMGRTTRQFYERMASSPELTMGLQTRERLCAWDGGLPIRKDGQLIGAIGVSGAAGPEDVECALAALKQAGFDHDGA